MIYGYRPKQGHLIRVKDLNGKDRVVLVISVEKRLHTPYWDIKIIGSGISKIQTITRTIKDITCMQKKTPLWYNKCIGGNNGKCKK